MIKRFTALTEKQKQGREVLLKKDKTEILFDGGARAGKTFLVCLYAILVCIRYSGIRVLFARLRFNHAKQSIWVQTLIPLLRGTFPGYFKENRTDWIITIGESEIWLGGLDDKDRVDKILGQEYGLIFLNEATQITRASRDVIKTRLAQNVSGWENKIIYDCNPRHPLHYLYIEFYKEVVEYRAHLHWMPEDNKVNLPRNYIEKQLDTLNGPEKDRFRFGKWVALPGAVYYDIKEENVITVDHNFQAYDVITVGVDFGVVTCASVWGHKDDASFCLWECTVINGTTKQLIQKLDNYPNIKLFKWPMFCDHEPDRIKELEDAGYNAMKAKKEVGAGDSSVNSRILYYDKYCKETFQSMLNLIHKQDKYGTFVEEHEKENDHHADTGRYAIHGYVFCYILGRATKGLYLPGMDEVA